MNYSEFLQNKLKGMSECGFKPKFLPDFLFPFQRDLDKWAIRKGRSALFADCGLGKGQTPDSPVLTQTGWVPIGNLAPGDMVISSDGKPYPVLGVYPKCKQDTYRIYFSDSVSFVVDLDHLHIVRTNNDRQRKKPWRVMSTVDLLSSPIRYGSMGKSRNYDIPVVKDVEFSWLCDLPIDPYVLGAFLGDGYIKDNLSISSADSELLSNVQSRLPIGVRIEYKSGYDWRVKTGSTGCIRHPFRSYFEELGLLGLLSRDKFIPDIYLYSSVDSRLAILRGLMDTDGYIAKCGTCQFYSVSDKLADGVMHLVRSLGGIPTRSIRDGVCGGKIHQPCHTITFSMATHNPFMLSRKAYRWNECPRDNGRWIDRIEFEKRQETVCISVDSPDSSYVTDHFIVTHNTPMQLVWAENVLRHTNKSVLILTPLSVSAQTVREGQKFEIGCQRSKDGVFKKGIVVTNYERLKNFNPDDFSGCVLDECFPAGTKIDTFLGQTDIEKIRVGDSIVNASGIDIVRNIYKREVKYAVSIQIGKGNSSKKITTSPNHPVFTQRGWTCAQDLEPGDSILQTEEAMRMVRGHISSSSISVKRTCEVLREILLSEMADASAAAYSKGAYPGSGSETWRSEEEMVCVGKQGSKKGYRTHQDVEAYVQTGSEDESISNSKSHEIRTFRTWRKRKGVDDSSVYYDGCVREWVGSRIEHIVGKENSRLSYELQSRLWKYRNESRYRGGWIYALRSQEIGREERQKTGFVGVEGIEILEQGHPELERLRSSDGKLYFYDIEAAQHPSFSVEGCLVHNSSVLKGFERSTRKAITDFMTKLDYRLLCSATPAPNDFMELGCSSEALGTMKRNSMLAMFFTNDQEETQQWRLKGHAKQRFWQWVASWARALRKPSDLGHSDDGFVLPPLNMQQFVVRTKKKSNGLLPYVAKTLDQQRAERRDTMTERCEKVVEIIPKNRPFVAWCHLNQEGDLLEEIIPGAVQVAGSDKDEVKEERLVAFVKGEIKVLVTKPEIAGFGMNWQHCADMSTFPSHSFERQYQMIRRCWRFGQKNQVNVNIVTSQAECNVMKNLLRKERQAEEMYNSLVREINSNFQSLNKEYKTEKVVLPSWL